MMDKDKSRMESTMNNIPFFSIIIPTRNRPELFEKALNSVIAQDFIDKEIIVINDGSNDALHMQYERIINRHSDGLQYVSLVHRDNGHGQSYSMNFGASIASGDYLAFLDDDDEWTDPEHLSRVHQDICEQKKRVDVYYSNQHAFFNDGQQLQNSVWIEDLVGFLPKDQQPPYSVDAEFLLRSSGFAHLNCSIFNKEFYLSLGGMDENIRYECDRDIFIRSIDQAALMLYQPKVIARHHIPKKGNANNMSTSINEHEKRLYQLRVYEKGILHCKNQAVKQLCITGKMYQLKFLAESFNKCHKRKTALLYAKQALSIDYSLKWHLFVIYLSFSNFIKKAA